MATVASMLRLMSLSSAVMNKRTFQPESQNHRILRALMMIVLPAAIHLLSVRPVEPVFGGDSNRHVVTSIFFRDFIADGQFADPKSYAKQYFEQYPALGLLVWPPMFHGVCGLAMLAFGTSATVARLLVLLSFAVSCWCVHRMARRVLEADQAAAVMIVYSVLPIIFDYSRDVMLEVPTLALVMLSADQFDLWLRGVNRRNLYFAAVAAAFAALTRFDAVVLLPFYLAMFVFRGGWKKLRSRHVLIAVTFAACLVGPVYLIIAREMGSLHVRQAVVSVGGSVDGSANAFLAAKNVWYYPSVLVEQSGWPVAALSVLGLLPSLRRGTRLQRSVFLALMLATYLTFSPLAELRPRHAIYWMPAVAFFAVCGLDQILLLIKVKSKNGDRPLAETSLARNPLSGEVPVPVLCGPVVGGSRSYITMTAAAYGLLFASAACASLTMPAYRVEGYREAAAYVLQHTSSGERVFFDGWWDGNFTYHMRHLDPTRSRSVIRGDRLLYDFVCVPSTDFQLHAEGDCQMLEIILDADPAFVVLENPQFFQTIEAAQKLRELVQAHPQIFEPVDQIPVKSSIAQFPEFQLDVLRFNAEAAEEWLEDGF